MRSDRERLRDIVEHAELIAAHLPASPEELDVDVVLSAALVRWVGIIGEAAATPVAHGHRHVPVRPPCRRPLVGIAWHPSGAMLCTTGGAGTYMFSYLP